jgi:hypothetical protein
MAKPDLTTHNIVTDEIMARSQRRAAGELEKTPVRMLRIEYTDTFGGEANYGWVRRAVIPMPRSASQIAIIRAAKKAMGLTGLPGETQDMGETLQFRPYKCCTVMFITVE